MEKQCFKCGNFKSLDEFYRHSRMADGHLNKCKQCTKTDVRGNYSKRRKYYSDRYRKRYEEDLLFKQKQMMAQAEYRKNRRDPIKMVANRIAGNAIRDGRLLRRPCEKCGSLIVEAHHEDYSKPLEVRWLCFKHHREEHGQVVMVETPRNRKPNVIAEAQIS